MLDLKITGFPELPTGFIVGMVGVAICRRIIVAGDTIKLPNLARTLNRMVEAERGALEKLDG